MVQKAIQLGILVSVLTLTSGITCGANPLRKPAPAPAAVNKSTQTPELAAADQRVDGAKAQWDRAKKQLEAARALLRAAEADYKAAVADRDALALRTTAENLADESGLPIATRPPVNNTVRSNAPVSTPPVTATPVTTTTAPATSAAPTPSAADLSATRIQPVDFAAQPADQPAEPIQMK